MNNLLQELRCLYPKYLIFIKKGNKYNIYFNEELIDIITINSYKEYIGKKRVNHIILDKNKYIVKKI
ncbi:MAG TPA: hypothetical protein PKY25_00965 [Bacilli bacterium]|nr:hypothetical protein [Bacilli bacterium]